MTATMKTQADLEKAFRDIRASTGWNLDGDNAWGFFFFDTDPKLLDQLSDELVTGGYRRVNLFEMDADGWMLHVERVERHDPVSLFARNGVLTKMAKDRGIAAYDGWDVAPVAVKKA